MTERQCNHCGKLVHVENDFVGIALCGECTEMLVRRPVRAGFWGKVSRLFGRR